MVLLTSSPKVISIYSGFVLLLAMLSGYSSFLGNFPFLVDIGFRREFSMFCSDVRCRGFSMGFMRAPFTNIYTVAAMISFSRPFSAHTSSV